MEEELLETTSNDDNSEISCLESLSDSLEIESHSSSQFKEQELNSIENIPSMDSLELHQNDNHHYQPFKDLSHDEIKKKVAKSFKKSSKSATRNVNKSGRNHRDMIKSGSSGFWA